MKKKSKSKFGDTHINMMDVVIAFVFALANLSNTQSIKAWEDLMIILKNNLDSIRNLQSAAGQTITGYAKQKRTTKTGLVEMSAAIMRSVYSYAITSKNEILEDQMFVSRDVLNRMKYNRLVTFTQGIIDTVTPLIPQLTNYNITTQLVQQWQAANTLLKNLLSGPGNAVANRVSINKDIQELLHSSMFLLDNQADGMALNFLNNPATVSYYNGYKANRKLKPYGHVPTQLRATCVNDLEQPVECHISIAGTQISADTENGYANLSGIPFGDQKVIIAVNNVNHEFGPFRFFLGQSLSLTFNVESGFELPAPAENKKSVNA